MGTNIQNNLIVQFQWDITSASTSVAISNDIERWQVVTASWCYAVLRNKNGSKIERVKGDAAAWVFTFTKRWLDQSDSDVEVAWLKKSWKTGQTMYITLLSSQIVDKQNSNTYGAGSTQTFDSLEFTGTSKGRVFADLAALNVTYPTPVNGLVDMYCTAEGQYFDSVGWAWVARASWVNPNASTTVAGKVELATAAERATSTSVGSTGALLVPTNDALRKTSSGAADENMIPILDATGKLESGFIPALTSVSQDTIDISTVYWETISARDPVVVLPDWVATGRVYKYLWDWSITWTSSDQQIMVWSTVVNLVYSWWAWLISVTAWTISWNTITYGSANTFTPASWSHFRWTPRICAVSSTWFILAYWYSWFGGWNAEWLRVVWYTISWTTITRWTDVLITNNATQQIVQSMCIVDTNKCAIAYNTWSIVWCTLSWTTVTAWTPVSWFSLWWPSTFVSTDKIAITDWTNIRLYTFSGTTPTQWNNLAIWTTYTVPSIKDIWSWYSIFTGTTGGNSQAFIVNNTWATPVKWTTVTYHTGATSVDWIVWWTSQVVLVSGSTRYANYMYSWTTLTLINTYTKWATAQDNINYVGNQIYIVPWQIIRNYKYYATWLAKEAWVLNDTKNIVANGWILWWFTWLIPWLLYYVTSTWTVDITWDYVLWKALSDTQIIVSIPYNTL